MFKKILCIFTLVIVFITIPFLVFAAEVNVVINDSSSNTLVKISQGSTTLLNNGKGYSGTSSITTNGSDGVLVEVEELPKYYYSMINDKFIQSTTLDSGVSSIKVDIIKFTPPSIVLSINSKGGVSYEISGSSPISNYEIEIFENNSSKGLINVTSTSGTLPSVTEGKSYVAAVRISGFGFTSEQGPKSSAVTVPISYQFVVKGTDGGTVSDLSDIYIAGSKISLSATASSGYVFKEWSSNGGGEFDDASSSSTTFTMPSQNVTVTALFVKTYKFVIMSSNGGKVWDVDGYYYEGQNVKVSAIPGDGYVFDSWVSSDGGKFEDSKAVATVFMMPANATTVTATFKEASTQSEKPNTSNNDDYNNDSDSGMFEIRTTVVGNGNIVINQSMAHEGQKITVRATAQAGYTFDSWACEGEGTFTDPKAAATTFIMPAEDITIVATFIKSDSTVDIPQTPPDDTTKESSSKSIFVLIGIIVVVVAASGIGVLLVLKERAKRRAIAEDNRSYFTGYDQPEQIVYDYEDTTREFQTEDKQDDIADFETTQEHPKNTWRQQRKRRNQYSDNIYRADDWDD